MGLITTALRALAGRGGAGLVALGQTVGRVAQVFRPHATRSLELGHDAWIAAHASHMAEFVHVRQGRFDALVNGLNRLPRPLLALGTLGLFIYAMADPAGFALRMRGLAEVPEPLWWLLGAVVAFYFGAREAHHLRAVHRPADTGVAPPHPAIPQAAAAPGGHGAPNPALAAWRETHAGRAGRDHSLTDDP